MKRFISALLVLCTLLALVCVPVAADGATTITPDTSWYTANTTEDVLYISDAADFLGLATAGTNFAGKTIKLTNDIDLNPGWNANVTVENGTKVVTMPADAPNIFGRIDNFAGTLDGCGHTVSGIYIKRDMSSATAISPTGFINTINTAKDVVIKDLVINNSLLYAIGPAGNTWNGGIGGLIGMVQNADATLHINNVYLGMDVVYESAGTNATAMVGGIIGRVENVKLPKAPETIETGDSRLSDCCNPQTGVFEEWYCVLDSVVVAGDVVAMNDSKVANRTLCHNSNFVAGANDSKKQIPNAAGTATVFNRSDIPKVQLVNCVNLGTIYSGKGESWGDYRRVNYTNILLGAKSEGTAITKTVAMQASVGGTTTTWTYFNSILAKNFTYSAAAGSMIPTGVAYMLANPFEGGKTYYQVLAATTSESASTDLRFVATFKGVWSGCTEVGFVISKSNTNPLLDGDKVTKLATNQLWSSIRAANETVETPEGCKWLAMGINGIPQADFGTNIYVRTYAITTDGAVVYGDLVTVNVNGCLN